MGAPPCGDVARLYDRNDRDRAPAGTRPIQLISAEVGRTLCAARGARAEPASTRPVGLGTRPSGARQDDADWYNPGARARLALSLRLREAAAAQGAGRAQRIWSPTSTLTRRRACSTRSSSPIAARSPSASSAPAGSSASARWPSTQRPTATACTCATPTRPSASGRRRPAPATWCSRPSSRRRPPTARRPSIPATASWPRTPASAACAPRTASSSSARGRSPSS